MFKVHKCFYIKTVISVLILALVRTTTQSGVDSAKVQITWTEDVKNLSRVYSDDHIAIYYDHDIEEASNPITWPFRRLSEAWNYLKETYGPFGPHSILYIALRNEAIGKCRSSNELSYVDKKFDHFHAIDCGIYQNNTWDQATPDALDEVLTEMGRMALKISKGTGNWPARHVSGWSMASVLVLDIFVALGRPTDAKRWKIEKTEEMEGGRHWFRDWYLPIYERHGGSVVLNKFFDILHLNWPRNGDDYRDQLNMGHLVHFWSGAAREDLKPLAEKAFNWTDTLEFELYQAHTFFPQVTYGDNFKFSMRKNDGNLLFSSKYVSCLVGILLAFLS